MDSYRFKKKNGLVSRPIVFAFPILQSEILHLVQNHPQTLRNDARFLYAIYSTEIGSGHWRNGTNFALSILNFEP